MESLFAIVHMLWVARLGTDTVAVIGLVESVMTIIYAGAIGISFAATAIVARSIGAGEREQAARSAGQILLLGLIASSAFGVPLAWFARDVLRVMGASDAVVAAGLDFARIMLGGNATVFLIFVINAIFRGAGDAVLAMRTLWLANAINAVLGPCLLFGWGPFPELGLTGAAVATTIARATGVIYQLRHLFGPSGPLVVGIRHLQPRWLLLKQAATTASNGVAQLLISTTSWIGLYKILAVFGTTVVAGYTVAVRIVLFALLPAAALSAAGQILVGQNLGAGRADRAEAAVKIGVRFSALMLLAVAVALAIGARPLSRLFSSDPEVLKHASHAIWISGLAFPLYGVGMCFTAAFNGAGDTWTPTRLNFTCFWLAEVPFAWLLAIVLGLGPLGVFIAVPVAVSLQALWSGVLFKSGRWKLHRM